MPDFQPVYGSAIVSQIAYHEPSRECYVKFANGETYTYFDVPPEEWEQLLHAPSKGKFVNLQLRRGHRYERGIKQPAAQEGNDTDKGKP